MTASTGDLPLCTFCGEPVVTGVPFNPRAPAARRDYCDDCKRRYVISGKRCDVDGCNATGRSIDHIEGTAYYACGHHVDEVVAKTVAALDDYRGALGERLMYRAGNRYWDQTIETFPHDGYTANARAVAVEWWRAFVATLAPEGPNLVLHGPAGTGKTGLALGLGLAAIERRQRPVVVEFVAVPRLLAEVKASFNGGPAVADYDFAAPLLILDDLGAERVTDWTRDYLARIVERRYDDEQPTIVTTNYAPSELARRIDPDDLVVGERIVSRLVDDAFVVELNGPNRRSSRKHDNEGSNA